MLTPRPTNQSSRHWWAYAGVCLLTWLLFVLASTERQQGAWQLWVAVYEASLTLWAPMLLGPWVYHWVTWLYGRERSLPALVGWHVLGACGFSDLWLAADFVMAWALFGSAHAEAMLWQAVLWRTLWGLMVYAALATGFVATLQARRARAHAVAAAEAESALARAELAAISGKLKPHFLFNTLNTLVALTRKDAKAAEQGLMCFAGLLRYVLDSKRGSQDRVSLSEELDFVRDYLALESLRLGARLKVAWDLDPLTLDDTIPPLSLQPLVENSVQHGIAPRVQGGSITISAHRDMLNGGLKLSVRDDGAGCEPAQVDIPQPHSGIGLSALKRRFALDFEGRARLHIHTAPGAGFRVDLWIPQL